MKKKRKQKSIDSGLPELHFPNPALAAKPEYKIFVKVIFDVVLYQKQEKKCNKDRKKQPCFFLIHEAVRYAGGKIVIDPQMKSLSRTVEKYGDGYKNEAEYNQPDVSLK